MLTGLNPDSAVERDVMSKEQTFRSEDNTFLPLIKRQLSVRCVTTLSKWWRQAKRHKRFQTEHSGVFRSSRFDPRSVFTAEFGLRADFSLSRA